MRRWFRRKRKPGRILAGTGLWFVDIPRTGSTSIKAVLEQELGPEYGKSYYRPTRETHERVFLDHTTARDVIGTVGERVWSAIYTFTFVRNPWERFHSIYKYRLKNGDLDPTVGFDSYVRHLATPRLRDPSSPFVNHCYHLGMCDFIMDENDRVLVDDVFRFERREEDLEILREKTGIDFSSTWLESTKDGPGYLEAYTDETAAIVGEFFKDDVRHFGYSFPGA